MHTWITHQLLSVQKHGQVHRKSDLAKCNGYGHMTFAKWLEANGSQNLVVFSLPMVNHFVFWRMKGYPGKTE